MASDFSSFYTKHFDAIYRFVYFRVSQNKAVAEDLTADIFVSAFKAFADFDPTRGEKAWIMTIARNKVINYWRDKKEAVDVDDVAFTLVGEDGKHTVEVADDLEHLRAAMAELKPNERTLIEKKYLLGYRYKEIADSLEKQTGSVRVETHRAMQKLKALMKKHV
ncbi:MAG: RNA polymerase sigma factor [Patescibacteria group bacterium]